MTEQRSRCVRCGTFEWEWADGKEPWEADLWKCQGCAKLESRLDASRQSPGSKFGQRVALFRKATDGI